MSATPVKSACPEEILLARACLTGCDAVLASDGLRWGGGRRTWGAETRLHPITILIACAIGAWLLSDAVLLTYALYHPVQHYLSTGWTLPRFVNHVRNEAPTMVLNVTGAVLVECLTRVWRRLDRLEAV